MNCYVSPSLLFSLLLLFFITNSSIIPDKNDDNMPKFWKASNPQFETF